MKFIYVYIFLFASKFWSCKKIRIKNLLTIFFLFLSTSLSHCYIISEKFVRIWVSDKYTGAKMLANAFFLSLSPLKFTLTNTYFNNLLNLFEGQTMRLNLNIKSIVKLAVYTHRHTVLGEMVDIHWTCLLMTFIKYWWQNENNSFTYELKIKIKKIYDAWKHNRQPISTCTHSTEKYIYS